MIKAMHGRLASSGIRLILSVLLLATLGIGCFAQPDVPVMASNCCHHSPCRNTPSQPSSSTCAVQPSNPGALAMPSAPSQVYPLEPVTFATAAAPIMLPGRPHPQFRAPDFSPPDLFLKNSAFLI